MELAPTIRVIEKVDVGNLSKDIKIVVSDDDVMREIVDRYLKDKEVSYDTTFLRWHKMNAITKNPIVSNQKISTKEFDKKMMELAIKESDKSSDWWRHVGAVLVKNGEVISLAHNKHAVTESTHYIEGEPRSNFDAGKAIVDLVIFQHGESRVIAEAAKNGISLSESEIYVTTFPCPSCAMLIANAGISKVYYRDGYSLLDAERILKQEGIEIIQIVD